MTKEILKSCLKQEFFNENKLQLSEELFSYEQKDIFNIIKGCHDKYNSDLTFTEVFELWKSKNPVATDTSKKDFHLALSHIKNAEDINPNVATELIQDLWKSVWARQGAELFLRISEGDSNAEQLLENHLLKRNEGYSPYDFGEPVTKDIVKLLEQVSDENRYKFNLTALRNIVSGIGKKEFGCLFATPEVGKTAFIASICVAPGGFVSQGARVLVLVNEEDGGRTMLRVAQCLTESIVTDIPNKIPEIQEAFNKLTNFTIKNVGGWDLNKIEAYIEKENADVVCIDQADKVYINGSFNATHERLRSLYTHFRELAKRQDIALLVVSQASADAAYKTKLTPFDLENSKIGKSAEVDLLIGISKHPTTENEEPDYTRFLSVCKNKLSGIHSTAVCFLNHQISRYED